MCLKILKKGPGGGTEWDTVREKSLFPRGSRCVAEQQQGFAGRPATPFASEHSLDLCVG